MSNAEIVEGIPSYLEAPAETSPLPPVESLQQVLPCHDLTWENFERLCVKIARLETDIERTQLYGVRGQGQQGIDLFARSSDGTYRVYQCKNVEQLDAADLRSAVDSFLEGIWATRAKKFVFCTTYSSVRTQLAEEYLRQTERLQGLGISFDVYDQEELSFILKNQPTLVHDFFGKAWVESFNGPEANHELVARLDPAAVGTFRSKLRIFYAALFEEQDVIIPLPAAPGVDNISLQERFVVPDLLIETDLTLPVTKTARDSVDDFSSELEIANLGQKTKNPVENEARIRRGAYQTRQTIETWVTKEKNSLITGGPGAGKSALLRYLALDILAESPRHQVITSRWGDRLPVWMPFAFWTKQIAEKEQSAITECIRQWLISWSKEELWPIIERALKDERLLLLVDGLDEWTNEEAGTIAIQRLQVFIKTHKARVVATSRPHSGLSIHGIDWQVAEIAPLSDTQQLELIRLWFLFRSRAQLARGYSGATKEVIDEQSQGFFQQLSESRDLDELAGVPLLLLLLIFLRFQNAELPRDRFSAYREVIDYLTKRHPAIKRAAAALITSQKPAKLTEREIQAVLSRVAYEIQINFPGGIIDESALLRVIEDYLNEPDGLGFELKKPERRIYAEAFTHSIEGASGLLAKQGVDSFSILHRSIQEFLAALYISRKDVEFQRNICQSRLNDPRWREVILGILWLLERPDEVATILKDIRSRIESSYSGFLTRELLAEGIFAEIRCPGPLAREIASEILDGIANEEWMAHRRRLLRFALNGLNSSRTRDLVRERLERWVFRAATWAPSWYPPLTKWPRTDGLNRLLLMALRDEEIQVQQTVAEVISKCYGGDVAVGEELAKRAGRSLDITHRAHSLIALAGGWPLHSNLDKLVESARESNSDELLLAAIRSLVVLGKAGDRELSDLVSLGGGRRSSGMSYEWHSLITRTLVEGWKGKERLKGSCLQSLGQPYMQGEGYLDGEIALSILLQGFPGDPDVVSYCISEIRRTDVTPFLFLHLDAWRLLSSNFAGNVELGHAADIWLERQEHRPPEVALAALIGKSEVGKKKLIEILNGHFGFWPATSLLRGWGTKDPEVASALQAAVYGDANNASSMADLLPEIIEDSAVARKLLMGLLRDSAATWKHRIIEGLARLSDRGDEDEIVSTAMSIRGTVKAFDVDSFDSALIHGFPKFGAIKELAKERLRGHYPLVQAVAEAYSEDAEMRDLVSKRITPLPVQLRIEAIQGMGRTVGDDFTLNLLSDYDTESNDEAKCLASIAFHRRLIREARDTSRELNRLSETIGAYGFDFEERRRAGFAGLLILGRLDLMNQPEGIGEPHLLAISLGSYFRSNPPLVRLVAENWENVKSAFGSDLNKRLTRIGDLPWATAMAEVAADFPNVQKDLWQEFEEKQIAENPTVLRLFAVAYPKSEALKAHCFEALRRDEHSWMGYSKLSVAADILAEQFGGDPAILEQLLGKSAASNLTTGQVLTIAAGWPECGYLQEAYELITTNKAYEDRPVTIFEVLYSKIPAPKFADQLVHTLNQMPSGNNYLSGALLRPVLRRVKNDLSVKQAIADRVVDSTDISGKPSLCRLLAAAGSLPQNVRAWMDGEVRRQLKGADPPEIGFDLFSSRDQSVVLSLLDAM